VGKRKAGGWDGDSKKNGFGTMKRGLTLIGRLFSDLVHIKSSFRLEVFWHSGFKYSGILGLSIQVFRV